MSYFLPLRIHGLGMKTTSGDSLTLMIHLYNVQLSCGPAIKLAWNRTGSYPCIIILLSLASFELKIYLTNHCDSPVINDLFSDFKIRPLALWFRLRYEDNLWLWFNIDNSTERRPGRCLDRTVREMLQIVFESVDWKTCMHACIHALYGCCYAHVHLWIVPILLLESLSNRDWKTKLSFWNDVCSGIYCIVDS
jgi:hypothetical protein